MTSIADILRSIPLFAGSYDLVREDQREAQSRDARALFLQQRRAISREDALRIAIFTRGTWAQRYPVRGYDLGEETALFIADWLSARAVGPSEDAMHEAFAEWQAREQAALLGPSFVSADPSKDRVREILKAVRNLRMKPTPSPQGEQVPNRFERRRAASRRWRG